MALRGNIASSTMYKKESDLLKAVIKWIEPQRRNGIVALKIRDSYAIGYSDLFICARGRFIVAELKDDTGTPSPHQEIFIEEMTAAGAVGGICRSVKEVSDLIDKALYCSCLNKRATLRLPAFNAMARSNQHLDHGPLTIELPKTKYCPHCGKETR